jgi:hypothetical protein
MGGTRATYGGVQRYVQGFLGNPREKRPLGSSRHTSEYNIKIYLTGTHREGVN